jgi:hypothetical protein
MAELVAVVAFVVLWVAAVLLAYPVSEFFLRRRMRREGRYLSWREVEQRLRRGDGTLVFNRSNEVGRVWWSPDPVEPDDWIEICEHSFLTSCPRPYRDAKRLLEEIPGARVIEITGHFI